MTIDITIVADQEAFLVDAPTPQASPRRWIQAKGDCRLLSAKFTQPISLHDPQLWATLRRRLTGQESPAATLADGSDSAARLLVYLGEQRPGMNRRRPSWEHRSTHTQGEIGIAQPGLSRAALIHPNSTQRGTAESIYQLLTVFADTIATTGGRALVLAS